MNAVRCSLPTLQRRRLLHAILVMPLAMPPLAAAFSATSITSTGDGFKVTGVTPGMPARNPHIRFFNNRRGYCRHERVAAFFRVP